MVYFFIVIVMQQFLSNSDQTMLNYGKNMCIVVFGNKTYCKRIEVIQLPLTIFKFRHNSTLHDPNWIKIAALQLQ